MHNAHFLIIILKAKIVYQYHYWWGLHDLWIILVFKWTKHKMSFVNVFVVYLAWNKCVSNTVCLFFTIFCIFDQIIFQIHWYYKKYRIYRYIYILKGEKVKKKKIYLRLFNCILLTGLFLIKRIGKGCCFAGNKIVQYAVFSRKY